jgi:hypothetical protein
MSRGVFEKEKGSGVWWIRFVDGDGHLHREVAGTKSAAIKLYGLRHDAYRMAKLVEEFGIIAAETITPGELESWLHRHDWGAGTRNRYRALSCRWPGYRSTRRLLGSSGSSLRRGTI